MALGSQTALTTQMAGLTGLAHEVFAKGVKWHVLAESPVAQIFKRAQRNQEYKILGEALVGAAQLSYTSNAMGSGGKLPDTSFRDAVQWQATPVRRYTRMAKDRFVAARAQGEGAFADFISQLQDQLWDSWGRMEIRHAIGDARGFLCLVSSRTSSTVWTPKDAYGHDGCHPLINLEPGMVIAWLDSGDSFDVDGAGKISSINYSTFAVTMDSSSTWEPGDQVAAGDGVVKATTYDITRDYFQTEYGNAPHGVMGIVDPDSNYSTVLNIAESGNERWKPLKETSGTFDQFEVSDHWRKLRARSTSPVTASSHRVICQGAVVAQLARTLGPYQQQQSMGQVYEGGYQGVRIAIPGGGAMEFIEDDNFLQDVMVTLCVENVYRADLGGEADFYSEDGSMWSRLPDEDADEAYVAEYVQTFSDRRNRHAALREIALPDVVENDFTSVPQ
jgi:hypothetical protein